MKLTLGLTVFAFTVTAASLCIAQSLPPVRQLGPVTAVAKEPLGAVSTVRHLPDGRVLVNDILGRRIVMFDSTLSTVTVIADTTSATAGAYGIRPGGLIAYRGDSTLFVDPASLSMLVIDPNGKIARVIAAPRAQDVGFLVGGPFGNPGFDPMGRLIYRAPPNFAAMRPPPTSGDRLPQFPTLPDSAALVRYDLTTRKVDTVTFFKTPKFSMNVTRSPDGGIRVSSTINPLPQGDDWVLLSDGTIALVRTKDYHVDWLNPDRLSRGLARSRWDDDVVAKDSVSVGATDGRSEGRFHRFGESRDRESARGRSVRRWWWSAEHRHRWSRRRSSRSSARGTERRSTGGTSTKCSARHDGSNIWRKYDRDRRRSRWRSTRRAVATNHDDFAKRVTGLQTGICAGIDSCRRRGRSLDSHESKRRCASGLQRHQPQRRADRQSAAARQSCPCWIWDRRRRVPRSS